MGTTARTLLALCFSIGCGGAVGCGDSGGSEDGSGSTGATDGSTQTASETEAATGSSTASDATSSGTTPTATESTPTTGATDSTTDGSSDDSSGDTGDDTGPQDGWYPGIPYPTDDLPGGIMPTLPTPGAQAGWPYDPIELALPEPSGAGNEYVVSTTGDDGSAGNGGNGTMAAPRRSLPLGDLGASAKLFIIGADSPYGTVDFDIGEDDGWTCSGTAEGPCFVVGIDTPRVGRRIAITNSTHIVIDGLSFVDNGGGRPWGSMNVSDSTYVTVRNVELRGDGSNSSGGSAMSMSNVEFLFAYRMQFHEIGSWEVNPSGIDVHGWRPAYGNRYLWLIDSELYHLQADGIQTGNSSNQNPQGDTSHYIYIAGNEFYENYENALDNKNSYHVVFSTNDVHDFYATEGMGANGTAVILSNNSEGPWTGYHWAINNRVWNTSLAFRDSGSEDGERNFMLGNFVWNANTAFMQANNSQDRECWIANNTAHGAATAFDMGESGNGASVFLHGNILHGGELDTQGDVYSELRDNILFGTNQGGAWDVDEGTISDDPGLADPEAGDMSIAPGGPAVDAMARPSEAYDIFESLYGFDARTDRSATPRPSGDAWDIGAVEVP